MTCACGAPASSSAPDNSTSANGAPVDGATPDAPAAQTPENEVPATASSGDILTLWSGDQNRLSAFDENGFYYLSTEKHLEGAENVKYIDFATRQEAFLCANPNCTHDTEACTSYFVTENGACEVFLGYGHLFMLNNSGVEQNVIKMCDQDGSNGWARQENAEILKSAVENGGMGGAMMGAGMGLGLGSAMGNMVNAMFSSPQPLKAPPSGEASTVICPSCNCAVPVGMKFCGQCGAPLAPPKPLCPGCGAEVPAGMKFCGQCGTRIG